ncbi:MAG: hypothetical protein HY011_09055 [Acidobacteria bacterium]|nr:hypothetical protein [Acidobacteriota bacterium]
MLTQRLSGFLWLALLCACAWLPAAQTQTPSAEQPQFFLLVVYRNLQPGYAAFIRQELTPARRRDGVKTLYAWSTAWGDLKELITLQPLAEADALEQFTQPENESGSAALWPPFTRLYEERLAYVIVTHPALSAQPLPVHAWPRLLRLRITTTAPQRDGAFAQWVQGELLPHAAQNRAATEWFAKLRYGGDVVNTFLSWRMGERFADLDAAFDRQATAQLQAAGVVMCDTDYWLRYRPDLSIVAGQPAAQAK